MENKGDSLKTSLKSYWPVGLIIFGALIYYLPYIATQFVSDDWLWLSNAKRAMTNPIVFLQRPMMGYFRPLNMLLVFIWLNLFGTHALFFSLINILLHCLNIWLLWRVLTRYGVSKDLALTSSFLFAFYCLNAPAIEWICVGHDLWVTALVLLMILKMNDFIKAPTIIRFFILGLLGISATLIKESGFISVGVYFLMFFFLRVSPFKKKFRLYSFLLIFIYMIYFAIYFMTRTYEDRQLVFGLETFINLWYFTVYVVYPFPPRLGINLSDNAIFILKCIRVILTFLYPILLVSIFMKAKPVIKLFIILPTMFMSTIAIIRWGHGLFSLYPGDTVARFMYSPSIGYAVVVAFILTYSINLLQKPKLRRYSYILGGILFIFGNMVIIAWSSQVDKHNQALTSEVISSLGTIKSEISNSDSLIVYTSNLQSSTPVVFSDIRLKAIIHVIFNKSIQTSIIEKEAFKTEYVSIKSKSIFTYWDTQQEKLFVPAAGKDY